jgi:hypothetical protein
LDRQARTDQRDSPDKTEPALANEPTESTEASEPADPIDRIEPADPIDRIEPADPMDRMDPLEPMLRIDPAEPISRRERFLLRIGPFSHQVRGPPGQPPAGLTPAGAAAGLTQTTADAAAVWSEHCDGTPLAGQKRMVVAAVAAILAG